MKQFFKMFFASLLGVIVASVIAIGLFIGAIVGLATSAINSKSEEKVSVKENSVLRLDLGESFHEQGEENSFSFMGNGGASESGVYEIANTMEAASKDEKIKGLFIKLAPSPNSFATLQQIRDAVVLFKKSGKFVYAYGESVSQGALYVASAADSIFVNPAGDVELKGLVSNMSFFKNTLSKLEIEPQIFYAGKFKSATEPFREEKMSEANRQQIAAIHSDIWNEMIAAVAKHAKNTPVNINELAQTGAIQFPIDAFNNKVIDGVKYWDEVESMMKNKLGVKTDKDISFATFNEYGTNNSIDINRKSKDNRVAVIFAEGQISDGEANSDYEITDVEMAKTIRTVRNNDKIKAVVLRVNSPGGSARASEIILRELQLLHQKKPIIVSMGDVAASGGYYIACAADSIFAMPTTITGSIGVFSMMFNAQKLMTNKLGVTFDQVKNAPFADFPNGTRPMTAEEAAMMQRSVDSIYALFKRRVAVGRRMTEANVDSIAQGRVWTGVAAKRLGLVDDLGNLERAIQSAASIAKIKDYEIRTYPEKVDKFKSFLKKFKGSGSAQEAVSKVLVGELGAEVQELLQLRKLRNMNGRAMMLLPFHMQLR
jgi:protease IV